MIKGSDTVTNLILDEILKVPGVRVVGSYTLDDVKEYAPVYLPSTSEVYCFGFTHACMSFTHALVHT